MAANPECVFLFAKSRKIKHATSKVNWKRIRLCVSTIRVGRGAIWSRRCDVRLGLPPLRREWITARGDVEKYQGRDITPIDDGYLTFAAADIARQKEKGRLEDFPALKRTPFRAKSGRCVTQLHYARRGIITPEMEFIAIRENLGRDCGGRAARRRFHGRSLFLSTNIAANLSARRFLSSSLRSLFVTKLRAAARSFRQTLIIRNRSR